MKDRYDFSKGKRGRIIPKPPVERGKVKITIRLDEDLIDQFGAMADASGGSVGYQTFINQALREYLDGKAPKLEDTLRRIYGKSFGAKPASLSQIFQMTSILGF